MTKSKIVFSLTLLAVISGCAEQQQQQAAYVSPLEFKNYNCKQIAKEMAYVSSQYGQATASNPAADIMGAALIAYGMSQRYAFSTGGEDPAVAQLRARYDALHQASIQKNCD